MQTMGRIRRISGVAGAIAVLALCGALVACGDDDGGGEETSAATSTSTTGSPDAKGGDAPVSTTLDPGDQGNTDFDPKPRAFCEATADGDAEAGADIVGMPVEEARHAVAAGGCSLRVVEEDGKSLPITQDFSTERVNVIVEDGSVVRVDGVY
jgi:hypothetical protein